MEIREVKDAIEKFVEAFAACGLAMVQGDLSVFTVDHFTTAFTVGLLTAIAYFVTMKFGIKNKYAPIWLLGVLTAIVDYVIHPAMFPYEALATGAGAMVLAILYSKIRSK